MKVPWMPAGSATDNSYSWPERMLSYPETVVGTMQARAELRHQMAKGIVNDRVSEFR